MCGIIGYIGKKEVLPILIDGLKRLEYRGYDSSGVVVLGKGGCEVVRAAGKIVELEKKIELQGRRTKDKGRSAGIAHTRWATHGPPTEQNAHPHTDCSGKIALVHNGIIENYQELKKELQEKGHVFKSDTDTEVLVHLVEQAAGRLPQADLETAVRSALDQVRGTYGVAVVSSDHPDQIVIARMGSPIVIGVGTDEFFVASDASALLSHTRNVIYLDDGEMCVLRPDGYLIKTLGNLPVLKKPEEIEWSAEDVKKGGQPHFMKKEMLEQPKVLIDSTRGRLKVKDGKAILGGLRDVSDRLRQIDRLIIVACGSAYYSGLVGEYMLEEYAGIPVEVDLASEFRYRKPIITDRTAVLAVSQSGETADTLAAIREAKEKGALTLGIVNTVGSTIARETDAGIYNHAGPEIGVASTKAFLSQATVFALLTLFLGRQRDMSMVMGKRIAEEIQELPDKLQSILNQFDQITALGQKYKDMQNCLYLGRKYCSPIAYEGALKLKEISYIHAEGYAAGEMKHGPIALIDPNFVSLVLCPQDSVYEKTVSNIEELRARGGPIIAVTTEGNDSIRSVADDIIYIPKTLEMLTPILAVVPLQIFAYAIATARGYDPDKPRNLAKAVTVE
jgi:glutamine---fructose-6-phosphate transaminase (isomerizing)